MDAVFPIKKNAKVADYRSDPQLEEHARFFNGHYKRFLETLNTAFNGHPELLAESQHGDVPHQARHGAAHPLPNSRHRRERRAYLRDGPFQRPAGGTNPGPASAPVTPAPVAAHADPLEIFLLLSVQLCGISSFDLRGTGYARRYFETVEGIVGRGLLHRLLQAFAALPVAPARAALQAAILNHPEFGPVTRNIMKLWYTATWFQLPSTWRENFGAHPKDRTFVPYPYAYPSPRWDPPSVPTRPAPSQQATNPGRSLR